VSRISVKNICKPNEGHGITFQTERGMSVPLGSSSQIPVNRNEASITFFCPSNHVSG
jgi:hypothetical protein